MDFSKRLLHPLPFYMTYPGYLSSAQESAILQDLEYLQQTYPQDVRRYQGKIAEILDKLDYEGSMIYDEFPDRYSLQRLADSIMRVIRQEELGEGQATSEEKWNWITDMIQVLLCDEIYKRRHGGRRKFF
ncbi:MAG: hypothetical protein NC417_06735 [Candidatus Gastranaerophilales bacterium]|nr:hypothetical protein [Candidatus Gastranaerophilales bacterium]